MAAQTLLREQNSCEHLMRCYLSGSFFKIKAWNYVWRLLTPWGSDRKRNLVDIPLNGAKAGYGTWSFQNRSHLLVWFSSGFHLEYQFCYTDRQYFDSFGNFRVFSVLDRKHSKVSQTVKILSVSITELILQAKPWGKSKQEVASILKTQCSIASLCWI